MKKLTTFVFFFFLLSGFCHAQSRIQVSVSSIRFDYDKMVYDSKRIDIESGEVFVYNESKDTCLRFLVINNSIEFPSVDWDEPTIVLLYYGGKYFYTNSFMMNSFVTQSPEWVFNIEESTISKKMFDSYYFSLSIPPVECGRVKFKSRWLYHHQGKELLRTLLPKTN